MPTVKAFVRTKTKSKSVVRLRISDGRAVTLYGVTDIEVMPDHWNPTKEEIKPRIQLTGESREAINTRIAELKNKVLSEYLIAKGKVPIPPDFINLTLNPPAPVECSPDKVKSLHDYFEEYRDEAKVSLGRAKNTKVFSEILRRYETIYGILSFADCTAELIGKIETFMRDEHLIQLNYPKLYTDIKRRIKPRGQNTLNDKLKAFNAFFTWARKKKYFKELPFESYEFSSYVYADPIPLLPEEVEALRVSTTIPNELLLVRDLFCLQCYLGCRVGDYISLRKENVQKDILMYIPVKTIEDTSSTVYVPINTKAMALIDKYRYPEGKLMPFIKVNGADGYNKRIKQLCAVAKFTRSVVVINPLTRKPETKPLCEVVSSHTARKTFINSNYIETQDPALISKMTGHTADSKAFARYRNIDLDILRKQINKTFGE